MAMAMKGPGRKVAVRIAAAALAALVAGCGVDGPPVAPAGGPSLLDMQTAPVSPGKTVSSDPLPVTVSGHAIVGVST